MLQTRTKEQKDKVLKILGNGEFFCNFPLDFDKETDIGYEECNERLYIDGEISFDQMAAIVDFLREEGKKMYEKARRAALKSEIDKLWVVEHAILMKGADVEKAEAFILSLAEFGYVKDELLNEYKKTGKITI